MVNYKTPRIAVLLAAYNGKKWIEKQINSILYQLGVDITIFVSVDISTDDTYEWCKNRELSNVRIVVLPYGERFGGAAKNFFRLISDVNFNNYDFVALADQDDLWFPNKIQHAIIRLESLNYDALSSDVIAFWDDGREKLVKKSFPLKKYDHFFEAAGPGCTYVFKSDALKSFQTFLIKNYSSVNKVALHDWMVYAYFRHKGYKWFIDDLPLMKYRQHSSNQIGFNSGIQAYKKRITLVKQNWYRKEVDKIAKLLGCEEHFSFTFRVKNFWQLRRRPRDAFALLFMNLFGIY